MFSLDVMAWSYRHTKSWSNVVSHMKHMGEIVLRGAGDKYDDLTS